MDSLMPNLKWIYYHVNSTCQSLGKPKNLDFVEFTYG